MKRNTDPLYRSAEKYYTLVYKFVYFTCSDSSMAEGIANKTFLQAKEKDNARRLKKMENPGDWFLHTARYLMLKEIYSSWEQGADIREKYHFPEDTDMDNVRRLIGEYEEKYNGSAKKYNSSAMDKLS